MNKVLSYIDNAKTYWKIPMKGRYMTFKEIAAYAGGGIGAYFIIQLGSTLIVGTQNAIIGNAIGVGPTDMYILYLISTIANIPLTAVRANIVDNTRNKAGKYRPYILSMGIPTALIAIAYVWFPYDLMYQLFPNTVLGKPAGYIIKCAMVLFFSLLLQFFFNFFNDAYTNLIHVLSPNTQERTDVLAVKSVVYSLAPSIMNIVAPLVAGWVAHNNLYDMRVYRYTYPVYAIFGIALIIVVYAHTQEKIVQAKTHTIQISFLDSLKEVAKNKYFWIIACAGWLGFLESCYGNILNWSFTYGKTCSSESLALINTLIGNASLWGMLLAPICIKKWGKKKVLIGVNLFNVLFILSMIVDMRNIWWLFACTYLNWLVGAFEQILTPAIQADIRDYQQYRSGERIDGMFAAVATIGNVVTLITSSILPVVQKSFGVYEGNGYQNPYDILDVESGQEGLLYKLMGALIIMAAVGALMNVLPFFFYDLTERDQKSVVRILKIRALFEDYGNGMLKDQNIVETVDIILNAKKMALEEAKSVDKKSLKGIKDKAARKAAKKQLRENKEFNEDIEISKIVCEELDKFNTEVYSFQYKTYKEIYEKGLQGLLELNIDEIKKELAAAKIMTTATKAEKELRAFCIDLAKRKMIAYKTIQKNYTAENFVAPDMEVLEKLFDEEDACDEKLKSLNDEIARIKKEKTGEDITALKSELASVTAKRKDVVNKQKEEMDKHAQFAKAARPYLNAEKCVVQAENYTHLEEIVAVYDEAKERYEAKLAEDLAKAEQEKKEQEEYKAQIKAEKAAKKNKKK